MSLNNIAVTIVSFAILFGGYLYGQKQYDKGYAAHVAETEKQLAEAKLKVEESEEAHKNLVKEIDAENYKELLDARKTIDQLRADVDSGLISLRKTQTSNCITTKPNGSPSMGNEQRAESGSGGRSVEQDILTLAEYAKTAIIQRDAAQEIIEADRLIEN